MEAPSASAVHSIGHLRNGLVSPATLHEEPTQNEG